MMRILLALGLALALVLPAQAKTNFFFFWHWRSGQARGCAVAQYGRRGPLARRWPQFFLAQPRAVGVFFEGRGECAIWGATPVFDRGPRCQ